MKKSILASMMLPALLTGCGTSSSGSSSSTVTTPVTYTWQIVQLASVSSVDDGCIVYADSETTSGNVITAYKATSGYNILYHYSDGSVADSYDASSFTDGKVTITKSDVPDDGYVSVEETQSTFSGNPDIYMFSVEKSLLSDLVVSVRTDNEDNSCYTGDDDTEVEDDSDSAVVYADIDGLKYYQTSYDQDSITGGTSVLKIPVASPAIPEHDVLITGFTTYDSDTQEKTDLSYFGFADPSEVFDSSDTLHSDVTITAIDDDYTWSYSAESGGTITLDESSAYAVHDDIIYYWQPLYESTKLTIGDSSEVTNWSIYLDGSESSYSWEFESYQLFDTNSDSELDFVLPDLDTLGSVAVEANCTVGDDAVENCIDIANSYSSDDFTVQRIHVEMTNDSGKAIYQSIYAPASDTPVLMESSEYSEGVTIDSLDSIDINLVKSGADIVDATQYLMSQNMNEVALGDDADNISDYSYADANGFVSSSDEREALELAMFESTTTIVKNSTESD